MRPGASRLPFAAAFLLAAGALSTDALAAPPGFAPGGWAAGPGYQARRGFLPRQPSSLRASGWRTGWGGSLGTQFGRYGGRDRAPYGLYGYGYGFGLGWGGVLDAAYSHGCCLAETGPAIVEQRIKLEWPTSIGIPPSPVQPPAIYVIGGERRNASVSRRTVRKSGAAPGRSRADSASLLASAPVFIPVPGGR